VQEAKKHQQSFGTTSRRFDVKTDIKEVFNRDPGPGSYKVPNNQTNQESSSIKGFGNGFVSAAQRFLEQSRRLQNPLGPGSYDPQIIEKHRGAPNFEAQNNQSLPQLLKAMVSGEDQKPHKKSKLGQILDKNGSKT